MVNADFFCLSIILIVILVLSNKFRDVPSIWVSVADFSVTLLTLVQVLVGIYRHSVLNLVFGTVVFFFSWSIAKEGLLRWRFIRQKRPLIPGWYQEKLWIRKPKIELKPADIINVVNGADGISHILADNSPNCPKCGAPPSEHEVRNHDLAFHDGDVHCGKCGTYARRYDAG